MFGSNALDAEENTGDFALTGIVLATIDGAEHGFQTLPLLGSYPPVGRHLVSKELAQKPVESSHVIEALTADRDARLQGVVKTAFPIDEELKVCPEASAKDMQCLRRGSGLPIEKHGFRRLTFLRLPAHMGFKAQHARIGVLAPEDGLISAGQSRTGGEIASPSGAPVQRV